VIRKHIGQVQQKWSDPIVYVRAQVTAYNRKRLIEQRVPFIVPGNQMFLPDLGLDLREYFRAASPDRKLLRPATQALLIYALRQPDPQELSATSLAPVLGYSAMTLSRALDELEALELAECRMVGRLRVLRFSNGPQSTWELAQPHLVDPVKSRHYVAAWRSGAEDLHAGHDALSRYTMIAEPRRPVFAIGPTSAKAFERLPLDEIVADADPTGAEVEIWKYEPREDRIPGVVEPLSLAVSLRGTADERVEKALDDLMAAFPW